MKEELILNYIKNFNPDSKTSKALILTGLPGVGKTYLMTKTIPSLIDIKPIIYNASLNRDKAFFNKVKQECQTHDVYGSNKVIILDECEELPTGQLKKVIETTRVPIVLICNFLDEIDWEIRKLCDVVRIDRPFDWEIERYLWTLMKDSSLLRESFPENRTTQMSPETIKNIAQKARSYRHARQLLENDYEDGVIYRTLPEQIQACMMGEFIDIQDWKTDPETLLEWIACNTMDSELICKANRWMRKDTDYSVMFLESAANQFRGHIDIKYPHTWRLMSEVKREKKEREEGKDGDKKRYDPRVKVKITGIEWNTGTFSQQEMTKMIEEKKQEKQVEKIDEWI